MNILASQNIFNRFNTLVNFRGKKEQKTVSNPLTKDSTSEKIINSVATSNGKAQVTMQNKPVAITPELRSKVKEFAERFEVKDEDYIDIFKIKNFDDYYNFFSKSSEFCSYCKDKIRNPKKNTFEWNTFHKGKTFEDLKIEFIEN